MPETVAKRFTITNTAGSLGDWLSLTPILRAMRDGGFNPLVIAFDTPRTRSYATLYEGLSEVEFVPRGSPLANTPETDEPHLCFAQRILNAHGLTGVSPIPYVEITAAERIAAAKTVGERVGEGEPVAFCGTIGGARTDWPDSHIANYRRLPDQARDHVLDTLRANRLVPVSFGVKGRGVVPGVASIPDLTLRQLAACYAVIGVYVGSDTGDHHLMLAAGGRCEVWVPPSTGFYQHGRHHYGAAAWTTEGGRPRALYYTFERAQPVRGPSQSTDATGSATIRHVFDDEWRGDHVEIAPSADGQVEIVYRDTDQNVAARVRINPQSTQMLVEAIAACALELVSPKPLIAPIL